jgi:predicted lipoprotein
MAEEISGLNAATEAFCRQPGPNGFREVKDAFGRAMHAWQRAQPIGFGPATWDGRASRIEFWPDKRGTAARQVALALRTRDMALIAEGGLEKKSVALQNLSTYERLVFDHGDTIASGQATPEDLYACALAAAIARYQSELAATILNEWIQPAGFREMVMTAARGNTRSATSA